MTTITIKEDIKGLPKEFKGWNDLRDYVLNDLKVQIKSLAEDEIDSELLEKVKKSKEKFRKSPASFDNI